MTRPTKRRTVTLRKMPRSIWLARTNDGKMIASEGRPSDMDRIPWRRYDLREVEDGRKRRG